MILVSHANFHKLKFPFAYSQKEIDNNNKPYDPVFSNTPQSLPYQRQTSGNQKDEYGEGE